MKRGVVAPICVGCGRPTSRENRNAGCSSCPALGQREVTQRVGGDEGLLVVSATLHEGTARSLVHRLKYQGLVGAADLLAEAMAPVVPWQPSALVPVPRAMARRVRYGIDPAAELARSLGRILGVAVLPSLRPALWWPHHAGRTRSSRRPPRFRVVTPIPPGAMLVDDVITTGRTLLAAASCARSGPLAGVTATAAGTM